MTLTKRTTISLITGVSTTIFSSIPLISMLIFLAAWPITSQEAYSTTGEHVTFGPFWATLESTEIKLQFTLYFSAITFIIITILNNIVKLFKPQSSPYRFISQQMEMNYFLDNKPPLRRVGSDESNYYYEINMLNCYLKGVFNLLFLISITCYIVWLMIPLLLAEKLLLGLLFGLPGILFLLPQTIFSFILLLNSKTAYITPEGFGVKNYLGHYFLEWDKIDFLKYNSGTLIVGNEKSYLSLPSNEYWGGKDKHLFIQQLDIELKKAKTTLVKTKKSALPLFKNCRIL